MSRNVSIYLALGILVVGQTVYGQLRITEVMYDSTHTPVSVDHNYWWELTNCGQTSVNLQGYSWDDNSGIAGVFLFPNLVIEPGESIVIVERVNQGTAVQDFRNCWGTEVDNVTILSQTDFVGAPPFPGFGLGGDLFLFDNADQQIDMVTAFPTPVQGFTIECPCGNPCRVSVDGENGAYQASCGDVGSPGRISNPIPTVSAWGLAAMFILIITGGTLVFRRRTPSM